MMNQQKTPEEILGQLYRKGKKDIRKKMKNQDIPDFDSGQPDTAEQDQDCDNALEERVNTFFSQDALDRYLKSFKKLTEDDRVKKEDHFRATHQTVLKRVASAVQSGRGADEAGEIIQEFLARGTKYSKILKVIDINQNKTNTMAFNPDKNPGIQQKDVPTVGGGEKVDSERSPYNEFSQLSEEQQEEEWNAEEARREAERKASASSDQAAQQEITSPQDVMASDEEAAQRLRAAQKAMEGRDALGAGTTIGNMAQGIEDKAKKTEQLGDDPDNLADEELADRLARERNPDDPDNLADQELADRLARESEFGTEQSGENAEAAKKTEAEKKMDALKSAMEDARQGYARVHYKSEGLKDKIKAFFGKASVEGDPDVDKMRAEYKQALENYRSARLGSLEGLSEEQQKEVLKEMKEFDLKESINLYDSRVATKAEMHGSKFGKFVHKAVLGYKNMHWRNKIALSGGLLVAGMAVGTTGFAAGLFGGAVLLKRGLGAAAAGVGATGWAEARMHKKEGEGIQAALEKFGELPVEVQKAHLAQFDDVSLKRIEENFHGKITGRSRRVAVGIGAAAGVLALGSVSKVFSAGEAAESGGPVVLGEGVGATEKDVVLESKPTDAMLAAAGALPDESTHMPESGDIAESPEAEGTVNAELLKKSAEGALGSTELDVDVPELSGIENLQEVKVEVQKGDTLWDIIEKQLEDSNKLAGMTEDQKIMTVDALKDEFTEMKAAHLKEIGFSSGDIDKIYYGKDTLDLTEVMGDPNIVEKAVAQGKGFTGELGESGPSVGGEVNTRESIMNTFGVSESDYDRISTMNASQYVRHIENMIAPVDHSALDKHLILLAKQNVDFGDHTVGEVLETRDVSTLGEAAGGGVENTGSAIETTLNTKEEILEASGLDAEDYGTLQKTPVKLYVQNVEGMPDEAKTPLDRFLIEFASRDGVDLEGKTVGDVLEMEPINIPDQEPGVAEGIVESASEDMSEQEHIREMIKNPAFLRAVSEEAQKVFGGDDVENIIENIGGNDLDDYVGKGGRQSQRLGELISRAEGVFGPEGSPRPDTKVETYLTRIFAKAAREGKIKDVFPSSDFNV